MITGDGWGLRIMDYGHLGNTINNLGWWGVRLSY